MGGSPTTTLMGETPPLLTGWKNPPFLSGIPFPVVLRVGKPMRRTDLDVSVRIRTPNMTPI